MQGMARPGGRGHSHWHQPAVPLRPPSLILMRCRRRRGHVSAMQGRKVQSAWARSGGIQMKGGTISFGIPCSARAGPSRPYGGTHGLPGCTEIKTWRGAQPQGSRMPGQAVKKRQGQTAKERQSLPKHNSQLRSMAPICSTQQKYVGV